MDREPLPLMSAADKGTYADWLKRLAGKRQGSHPDRLRQAASEIKAEWRFA